MFHPHPPPDRGPILLAIAHGAIASQLGMGAPPFEVEPWLQEPGATFVTLKRHGLLRGCIGTLSPRRPLGEDVAANAREAAFHDSRFPPLSRSEFPDTEVEVSLLGPLEALSFDSQAHLMAQLRPHEDGLVLEWGGQRAAFLPQVWDQLGDPGDFLAHLKQKAGLPGEFWDDGFRFARFSVMQFQEPAGVGHRR
ncbi:AmmeMemoRadiSam system protein A [Geothrix oryzisoli]|uniref:AmmeMemoRadiSam system protein A n=1 Tax=Geothrix oryzisoli TaxID=2922721 RepID=UPI001FADFFAA|nr:AmmeMemoRadiSam system protein A [Geothrix oryzisoli]